MTTDTPETKSKTVYPTTADMTPDKALTSLRSLVFDYERTLTGLTEEEIEKATKEYHTALVVLEQYIEFREDSFEETLAKARQTYRKEKRTGAWR
jgi:hypothetical protein